MGFKAFLLRILSCGESTRVVAAEKSRFAAERSAIAAEKMKQERWWTLLPPDVMKVVPGGAALWERYSVHETARALTAAQVAGLCLGHNPAHMPGYLQAKENVRAHRPLYFAQWRDTMVDAGRLSPANIDK